MPSVRRRTGRMRVEALVGVFACLCVAKGVRAIEPVEIVTADITGRPDTTSVRRTVELGAQFAIPLPAADIARTELGLRAGLSVTDMMNPTVGVGLDASYDHLWSADALAQLPQFERPDHGFPTT